MDYLTLLKGVELFKMTFDEDPDYKKFVLDRRQVWENIDKITENDVKETIIEFLKNWGIRNVNRIIPGELKKSLVELKEYFEVLHDKSLINLDFNEIVNIKGQKKKISEIIKEIYKRIREIKGIGPTAASKIMHSINPSLFMG